MMNSALAGDGDQGAGGQEDEDKRGAAVGDERERNASQGHQGSHGGNVDEGLKSKPDGNADGHQFAEHVGRAACDF